MNIEDLTIKQGKELAAMFGTAENPPTKHVGKKCIIRTYASGVHYGTVAAHSGRQVELTDARRLWRFKATSGISLSGVAQNGIDKNNSIICDVVPSMTILDCLEIIPASEVCIADIESAPVAEQL